MIAGCHRGVIVSLKWDKVNWKDSSIRIDTTLLYAPEQGVYESTTKTGADLTIKLPKETMGLFRQYRVWQLETQLTPISVLAPNWLKMKKRLFPKQP